MERVDALPFMFVACTGCAEGTGSACGLAPVLLRTRAARTGESFLGACMVGTAVTAALPTAAAGCAGCVGVSGFPPIHLSGGELGRCLCSSGVGDACGGVKAAS